MLDQIAAIMKLVGLFTAKEPWSNRPKLRRTNKIQSIYSSLAIENNQLSVNQVRDIIEGKSVIGPSKDILEVKNAIKVYDDIFNIDPYDEKDLMKYHGIMMESLIPDAGRYRTGQEGVFDGDRVVFIAPPADRVPLLMAELYEYLNQYEENFLIRSCVFHYEFEFIHPFSDGNGRMGRLFQTCLLASEEKLFAFMPIESIIKERQQEYYDVIAQCNQEGKSDRFIEFMLDAIVETLRKAALPAIEEATGLLSTQAKRLLDLMKGNLSYTRKELMDRCKIKSRVSFVKYYLHPLLENQLVEMTIPDTPNSRNQRYVKKSI